MNSEPQSTIEVLRQQNAALRQDLDALAVRVGAIEAALHLDVSGLAQSIAKLIVRRSSNEDAPRGMDAVGKSGPELVNLPRK